MGSKTLIILTVVLAVLISFLTVSLAEAGSVRGYYRKDGIYVRPHFRSNPDNNPYNNYNFPGNYNPNTGSITPGDSDAYLYHYSNRSHQTPYNPSRPYNDSQWYLGK